MPVATSTTDPALKILRRAEELACDLELQAVRRWKQDNPAGLAVGYLPIYAPRPLLEALHCLPVAIFGGGDQLDIIRGDSYFQSYICHIPRSVIELGLTGRLAPLDGMIFPSICDVIRNLGGMWKLLFPDRYAAYLDLPQNFDPAVGGCFYASELRRIAAELEKRGARPLDGERLARAIDEENTRRALLEQLAELRRHEPWRLKASEAYLLVRAGSALTAVEHTRLLQSFLDVAPERPVRPLDNVRVLVQGSFCEQPPLGLIRSLEIAGCDIVEDDLQLGMHMIEGAVEIAAGEDGIDALARAFLEQGVDTASRYIADDTKGRSLIERAKACRVDGVVFSAASFCDPALLDQPMQEKALERAGIPYTSFKFSENTGQFHVIREQAGAFSDAVKLWGAHAP